MHAALVPNVVRTRDPFPSHISEKERPIMSSRKIPFAADYVRLTGGGCPHVSLITVIFWIGMCAGTGLAENRSYDGAGNNQTHPDWGAAGTVFQRVAPASYGDGISEPVTGGLRADRVSDIVSIQRERFPAQQRLSGYVYQFGQFLNHDLERSESEQEPFFIPGIIPVFRTEYDESTGTELGNPRQQRNRVSHYLDGSNVYGSDETRASPTGKCLKQCR